MEVIRTERRLCACCMEKHDVKTVRMGEHTVYKNVPVDYMAEYYYCDAAEELYMDEDMASSNDICMKDAYRKTIGVLTSKEIRNIRAKYDISQRDLSTLLGWGGKTITRYESHQVQDRAHDMILKKLDQDPEWYFCLLTEARSEIAPELYKKYLQQVTSLYEHSQDSYLRKSIEAKYIRYQNCGMYNGNRSLSLDKVVDMIRYFSNSPSMTHLYKVKLMKLLWYGDYLSYKRRGCSISGLIYRALPMGAVPIGHDSIIHLRGVDCEEIDMGNGIVYRFNASDNKEYQSLLEEERAILDVVIKGFGKMTKNEIVSFMYNEQAYTKTLPGDIIQFIYADNLSIE